MFNLNLVSLNPLCFRAAFVWKENLVRRWLNMLSDYFCPCKRLLRQIQIPVGIGQCFSLIRFRRIHYHKMESKLLQK